MYPAYITQSQDQRLAYPHYSDARWNRPQLIYHDGCVRPARRSRSVGFDCSGGWPERYASEPESFEFDKAPKTDECNYSDRLQQWNYEASEAAAKQCAAEGVAPRTARWIERYLSLYHEKPVTLRYVLGGCNLSSGYEYYVYGYDYAQPVTREEAKEKE